MKLREPVILLLLSFFLPLGVGDSRILVLQVLLSQIRAIHIARQAEKKLDLNLDGDTDEALREFLASFWLAPDNVAAYTYLGVIAPYLGLFNHPVIEIRRQVASNKFEFSKHAVDQLIGHQIRVHEIKEAIANGELIEDYSNEQHDSSYLICGLTQAERPIYIKLSYHTRPLVQIMTVYEPTPEQWDDNFTIRRGNNNNE